ncbi:MAG: HAD family phosphatase [Bacteroides sp.]|nr:HAD family phosphatase [Bacteroides sp.]
MEYIKNLVFDFGGVIADIDRDNAVSHFRSLGLAEADTLLDKYHQKGIFLEVEDGRIDARAFAEKLSKLCRRELSVEQCKQAWLSFFTHVPIYKLDYLNRLKNRYRVFVLSNTNPFVMSWARSKDFTSAGKPLDDYVEKIYASYEMGCVKPDKKIFERMIEDAGIRPGETLFIDDGTSNIERGQELGFLTFQPKNGEDWRDSLTTFLATMNEE